MVADSQLYETLNTIHQLEQQALASEVAGWTKEKSVQFNKSLLPVVSVGREFNQLLKNWKPGDQAPSHLVTLIQGLSDSVNNIVLDFPEGKLKTEIMGYFSLVQSTILNTLAVLVTIKGA